MIERLVTDRLMTPQAVDDRIATCAVAAPCDRRRAGQIRTTEPGRRLTERAGDCGPHAAGASF